MPREVVGERARGGPGRGVLGDAEPGPEHPRLPARPAAGEAVDPDGAERLDALELGLERGDLVLGPAGDEHVPNAVVVQLDRQLRLDSERGQQLVRVHIWAHGRQRLHHAAEDDSRALALERHGHGAARRLDPDLAELEWRGKHERGAERRVSGERKLGNGREDPHANVPVAVRRVDERRFGEVQLPREPLELPLRDLPRVGEDGELVSGQRLVREHVDDDVAMAAHGRSQAEDVGV